MADQKSLPLGIDHKTYIKTLQGDGKNLSWKQFTDVFWNSDALRAGVKNEFLFRRGFLRDKWVLYGFDDNDPEEYLSDFQAAQINQANGIYANVLQDRMLLNHTLADYCVVPKIHALRGLDAQEVALSGEWAAHHTDGTGPDLEVLIEPLLAGARGKVEVVNISNGRFEGLGKTGDMKLLSDITRDWSKAARLPYLFADNLQQGPFMSGLHAGGQNRLSVILTRNLDTWDPVISAATLMIGTGASDGRLTLARGGLSAPVDLATGTVGAAAGIGAEQTVERHDTHPETGAALRDLVVPEWQEIRAALLRIMDESSYMRVAMLDFTLLADGRLGLIGPSQLDLSAVQVHQPLLRDPVFTETMRKLTL